MNEFEKGYDAACDDFEKAMKLAAETIMGAEGVTSYNNTEKFIKEMRKLRFTRFSNSHLI